MSAATAALGACASVLLAGGAVSLARRCLGAGIGLRLGAYEQRVARGLRYLQSRASAAQLVRGQLALACAAFVLGLAARSVLALAVAATVAYVPQLVLERMCQRRTARIEMQLDTWLVVLANALRATPSLGEALLASAARIGWPLGQELRLVCSEAALGTAFDRALQHAAARIDSPAVRAAFATLRVARNAGGDVSRTLDASAASLREMARLHGVLRAKTAEGRAQSTLIALLPLPLIGLLEKLSPDLLAPVWGTPRGHVVLAIVAALWSCAVLAARRITAVEI